jgi:hypothetical protein
MDTCFMKNDISLFRAKTFKDFISPEDVGKLVDFAETTERWEPGSSVWHNRVIGPQSMILQGRRDLALLINDIREKIKSTLEDHYGEGKEIYCDLIQLIRWFPGMDQPPHADDMKRVPDASDWFHHRDFGVILYLNDNYQGGHTYYPQYDFEVVPVSGMLATHPGDDNHLHGVTKIEGGMRYTIASFWTFDKEYEHDYSFIS